MYYWLIPLSFLVLSELVADIFAKEYSLKGHNWLWVCAIIGYIFANIFWLSAIKNGSGLARGAILFSISSAVVATILGIFIYHESLNKIQIIGIVLGLLSITLIFWE